MLDTFRGILIPFLGTVLGAACVLFLQKNLNRTVQRILTGFAAGVMTAASVWSLLIPALEQAQDTMGRLAFLPAAGGFLLGIFFLLLLDRMIPHLHMNSSEAEGIHTKLSKSAMLILAVTLHNIPEGMAVGVVLAGMLEGGAAITSAGALTLAVGIAIQNFPEGAVVSAPLLSGGLSRRRAFLYGAASGVVEPLGAIATILLTALVTPILPYILSFAAGAMIYVVVEELIPESQAGTHSNIGTIGAAIGFALMMTLDVALG